MKTLNIELITRALKSRKKELLFLREQYERDLNSKCSYDKGFYDCEYYNSLKFTIDNLTNELIDIIEELEKLEDLK